ncbi:MAG: hypothetical protein LAT67_09800 [Balneolales bacterium]|nr:hypothetical protein [Balneolales bacterium]
MPAYKTDPQVRSISKPGILLATITGATVLLWLFLFSFSPLSLFRGILLCITVSVAAYFLGSYFNQRRYKYTGVILSFFALSYIYLIFLPTDKYGSKPADEIRIALIHLLKPELIRSDFLFEKHLPPYSGYVAAAQKYRDELPQKSWIICFSEITLPDTVSSCEADQYFIFNIRNDVIGTSYPDLADAEWRDHLLSFEILQQNEMVLYQIRTDTFEPGKRYKGIPSSTSQQTYYAVVYPHLLQPEMHSRFMRTYYAVMNLVF